MTRTQLIGKINTLAAEMERAYLATSEAIYTTAWWTDRMAQVDAWQEQINMM